MTATTTATRGALLVGSVNLPDTESVLRAAGTVLGDRLARIPDGETGERYYWINFQTRRFDSVPQLERVGDPGFTIGEFDARPLRIRDGVDPATIVLPNLGYADAAIESFEVFRRLQAEGVISASTRFQVSLPTPAAVIGSFVSPDSQAAFEPIYTAALDAELARILDAIPRAALAIQWDTAVEFGLIETVAGNRPAFPFHAWFGDDEASLWAGLEARLARQIAAVPADVELGFHLCYGDIAEAHFVQPVDAAQLARYIRTALGVASRPVNWFHLPVPIERDDAAYAAPLAELALPDGTELYLGLVHREDGAAGAARRIAAAHQSVPVFGVATECGIGRSPDGTTEAILRSHAEVATAW